MERSELCAKTSLDACPLYAIKSERNAMVEIIRIMTENTFIGVVGLSFFILFNTQILSYINASIFEMRLWRKSRQVIAIFVRKLIFTVYLSITLAVLSTLEYGSFISVIINIGLLISMITSMSIWIYDRLQKLIQWKFCLTQRFRLSITAGFAYSIIFYLAKINSDIFYHNTGGVDQKSYMVFVGSIFYSVIAILLIFFVSDIVNVSSRKVYVIIDNEKYHINEGLSDDMLLLKCSKTKKYKAINIKDLTRFEIELSD